MRIANVDEMARGLGPVLVEAADPTTEPVDPIGVDPGRSVGSEKPGTGLDGTRKLSQEGAGANVIK